MSFVECIIPRPGDFFGVLKPFKTIIPVLKRKTHFSFGMIQMFFIHPHENINLHYIPRSQFSPQVHHHGRGEGFLVHKKTVG